MTDSKLSEVHRRLMEYGITIQTLSGLTEHAAIELLNYKRNQLKEYISPSALKAYYHLTAKKSKTKSTYT